jgi:hypothetical protein
VSIQRIENGTESGWQARQYTKAPKYLSAFFADRKHGGKRKAKALAQEAEAWLRVEAGRVRGRM